MTYSVVVRAEKPRFRPVLPRETFDTSWKLRNALLDFGHVVKEREMTPRQRALPDLCHFDGSTHNGGLGMGFEVFEKGGRPHHYHQKRLEAFFQLLRDIEASEHLHLIQSWLSLSAPDTGELDSAYFALRPDLIEQVALYVARFPDEWFIIS